MNENINVLSYFDGMSCGQIALERAGIKVKNYYACEIDKWAIKVVIKNYPGTQQLGDVTKIDLSKLPKIDLLIGGSPCQGFSFAGKQLNFEDPRSKLFFEFVKAKNYLNPKYFLLENVRMKKEYQDEISKLLGCEPIQINSSLVSAQNRRRLYWTNIPGVQQPEDRGINLSDILEKNLPSCGVGGRVVGRRLNELGKHGIAAMKEYFRELDLKEELTCQQCNKQQETYSDLVYSCGDKVCLSCKDENYQRDRDFYDRHHR